MQIIQETFEISQSLIDGLNSGNLERIGGVIRVAKGKNKGQVVEWLRPIKETSRNKALKLADQALKFMSNNKGASIALSLALVGSIGIGIYKYNTDKVPEVVGEFNKYLREYISAISDASLTEDLLDNLINTLKQLKEEEKYNEYKLDLTTEEFSIFVNGVYEYTRNLANINNMKLEEQAIQKSDDSILNLENYLNLQKEIFKNAA